MEDLLIWPDVVVVVALSKVLLIKIDYLANEELLGHHLPVGLGAPAAVVSFGLAPSW